MLHNPTMPPDHLAKQALVYVRQSTPKQVLHKQERQRVQVRPGRTGTRPRVASDRGD
jgi:DNA invertase Pin-like site-specific DNA recombinase